MRFTAKLLKRATLEEMKSAPVGSVWVDTSVEDVTILKMGPDQWWAWWVGVGQALQSLDANYDGNMDDFEMKAQFPMNKPTAKQLDQGVIDRAVTVVWNYSGDEDQMGDLISTWAESQYGQPLGEGASRRVYGIDGDSVLKVAYNEFGLRQNRCERLIFAANHGLPLNNIQVNGAKDTYLVVDRANSLDEKVFQKEYGITFEEFINEIEGDWESWPPKALELAEKIHSANIQSDIGREEQWGQVKDKSVITDYGLNDNGEESWM